MAAIRSSRLKRAAIVLGILFAVLFVYAADLYSPKGFMSWAVRFDSPMLIRAVARAWPSAVHERGPVYIVDLLRLSPLLHAAQHDKQFAAEALLLLGADVNDKSGIAYSALSFASVNQSRPMMELLLNFNARVLDPDRQFAPLMLALERIPESPEFDGIMARMIASANDEGLWDGAYPDHLTVSACKDRWLRMLLCSVPPERVEPVTRQEIRRWMGISRSPATLEALAACGWTPTLPPEQPPSSGTVP